LRVSYDQNRAQRAVLVCHGTQVGHHWSVLFKNLNFCFKILIKAILFPFNQEISKNDRQEQQKFTKLTFKIQFTVITFWKHSTNSKQPFD
jgi:hypothetical protein